MKLSEVRAVLTGAGGGIGRAVAFELAAGGASVLLVGRAESSLRETLATLDALPGGATVFPADVTSAEDRERLARAAEEWWGGANVLINNAGMSCFGLLETLDAARIQASLAVNLHAPIELCRTLLPVLRRRSDARIVNVGSALGAIGLPGHAVYAAAKFGMRGFSEALRRELRGTGVSVKHFAPRATRTSFNTAEAEALNAELKTTVDAPAYVARELVKFLLSDRSTHMVGLPERAFARINTLMPGLVDIATKDHAETIAAQALRPFGRLQPGDVAREESGGSQS